MAIGSWPEGVTRLILVDGEEELSTLAGEVFAGVPVSAACGTWAGASPGPPAHRPGQP